MRILYFDTETTGLSPLGGNAYGKAYQGHICQLTYIIEDEGELTAKNFYFAVDYVEYGASKVNGLTPSLLYALSGGREFSDDYDEISKDFAQADVIVAHNFAFDCKFMQAEYRRLNGEFIYKNSFCTMKGTKEYLQLPGSRGSFKAPNLAELATAFGVEEDEVQEYCQKLFSTSSVAHDARYDTVKLMLACVKGREECPALALTLK